VTLQPIRTQPVAASRLIACLLAFSAGLLALTAGLAWTFLDSQPATADIPSRQASVLASDSVVLVEQFYTAVNDAIATGNVSSLTDLVGPAFAEHPSRVGFASGRDGLLQTLLTVHATNPDLRIVLDSAVASRDGDEVSVRLHTTGIESGAFLGFPLPDELSGWGWGPIELLRVADGKIAERWIGREPVAMLQPLAKSDPLPGGNSSSLDVIALLRLNIAPDSVARFTTSSHGRFIVAETGSAAVRVKCVDVGDAQYCDAGSLGEAHRLDTGASVLVPARSEVEIVNVGPDAASLLVTVRYAYGFSPTTEEGIAGPALAQADTIQSEHPGGVDARVLLVGIVPLDAEVRLAFGRVVIPAGSTLTWSSGPAVLLAVDAGSLTLTTDDVSMEGLRAGGERWFDDDVVLEQGDGAALPAGVGFTWRNPSSVPAQLLLLSLTVE
jgi:hypothetical protein